VSSKTWTLRCKKVQICCETGGKNIKLKKMAKNAQRFSEIVTTHVKYANSETEKLYRVAQNEVKHTLFSFCISVLYTVFQKKWCTKLISIT